MSCAKAIPCCWRIQLIVLYCFIVESGLHRPDFALLFHFHPGVLGRELRFGTVREAQLCGFSRLSLHQPFRQQHRIRSVDAEEDVQDFRLLPPGFDPTHVVMLLLRSERALHRCRPHPRKFPSYKVFLVHFLEGLPPLYEGGLDFQLLAEVSVCRAGIARVPANLFRIHPEKTPVHLDAVRQPGPFIEGVERKLLNERYPIHQDVVALGAELHVLRLLPSHDRPHIRLAHAHDPVRDALAGIAALEVVALLAVRRVCLLDIQELCPRTMDSQLAARLAHQVISLLHALPQQFLVGRIAHLALVAGRIREHLSRFFM